MFLTLLLVTFCIAAVLSILVALLFKKPLSAILDRIVSTDLGSAWRRYLQFAIFVVGVSGGVRVWDLEKYINPAKDQPLLVLNSDRWVLEVYRTIIGTFQSIAWMLLIFFLFALIAYVLVRGFEMKHSKKASTE
ncbi:MAG: hypothetical protein ONB44_10765 [candidate division KSB1 bacterium]|nr:hypothetical protein [candidate division KSB1 bacterium]MDZ7302605.1 hypothetical protein [candidate division KSB1 bacterium]MDZ7311554.1 hypothetical protein [candidate division KSB1 bacterium]